MRRRIEPSSWFGNDEQRPVNLALELYTEPSPYFELVVLVGYHGDPVSHESKC